MLFLLSILFELLLSVNALQQRQVGAAGGSGVLSAQNYLRRGFHACKRIRI